MDTFLTIGKIGSVLIWIVFWLFTAAVYWFKKDEFKNFFAGIKKIWSSVVELFIFFTVFNTLLWLDNLSMINRLPIKLAYILVFSGYILALTGFVTAMKAVLRLGVKLPENVIKIDLFKYQRNLTYLAFACIAIGFSLAMANIAAFAMAIIILIPLLKYRVKIENKANLNI